MHSASETTPTFPGLVPELLITDLAASLGFWVRFASPLGGIQP